MVNNITNRDDGCDSFAFISSTIIFTASILYLLVFALSTMVANFWKLYKFWDKRTKYRMAHLGTICLIYNTVKLDNLVVKEYQSVIRQIRKPEVEEDVNRNTFAKYVYPTISDSIADANSVDRRIFNILTTICIFIILFNLWFEYASFSTKVRNATLAYYILQVICLLFLVMVPLFPNTGVRLHPPWFREYTWIPHMVGVTASIALMITTLSIYINYQISLREYVVVVIALFSVAMFFAIGFIVFYLAACIFERLTKNPHPGQTQNPNMDNYHAMACCFLYVFEFGLLLFVILSFLFASWYKNLSLECFPTQLKANITYAYNLT